MHIVQGSREDWTSEGPLASFIHRARSTEDLPDLVAAISTFSRLATDALACGLALCAATGVHARVAGVPERLADRYRAFTAHSADPLSAALPTSCGVVRSNELFSSTTWHRHPFYGQVLEPFGLDEAMTAEVYGAHASGGFITVARSTSARPFAMIDALRLQVLALHTSQTLIRINRNMQTCHLWETLTPRQQQLTRMIANGFTNEQAAHACNITVHAVKKILERMFVKFHVSSRTELIATLGARATYNNEFA